MEENILNPKNEKKPDPEIAKAQKEEQYEQDVLKNEDFKRYLTTLQKFCQDKYKFDLKTAAIKGLVTNYDGNFLLKGIDKISADKLDDKVNNNGLQTMSIKSAKLDYRKLYNSLIDKKIVFTSLETKKPLVYEYNDDTASLDVFDLNKKKRKDNIYDKEPLKWYKVGIALIYSIYALIKKIIYKLFIENKEVTKYNNAIKEATARYVEAEFKNKDEEAQSLKNRLNKEKTINKADELNPDQVIEKESKKDNVDLNNLISNEAKENEIIDDSKESNIITNEDNKLTNEKKIEEINTDIKTEKNEDLKENDNSINNESESKEQLEDSNNIINNSSNSNNLEKPETKEDKFSEEEIAQIEAFFNKIEKDPTKALDEKELENLDFLKEMSQNRSDFKTLVNPTTLESLPNENLESINASLFAEVDDLSMINDMDSKTIQANNK